VVDDFNFSMHDDLEFICLEGTVSTIEKTSWENISKFKMSDLITRQMVMGDNTTVALLKLEKGAVVPRHSHINEQIVLTVAGLLRFVFDDREVLVSPGEVLTIPPSVPHSTVAVEDSVDYEIFAPRREDWIPK
jgi:quercetin dioxygenase-like cupin family protein